MTNLGGITGLLEKFDAAGLGVKARSWIGDGQKEPISGAEVQLITHPFALRDSAPAGLLDQKASSLTSWMVKEGSL